MKRIYSKLLPIILFALLLSSGVTAASVAVKASGFPVYVSGKVTDDANGQAIQNHEVYVAVEGLGYSNTVFTNSDGFYFDTIPDVGSGYMVQVGTLDCEEDLHSSTFQSIQTPVVINFKICVTPPPSPCHAQFNYLLDTLNREPNTFCFQDVSTGDYGIWLWHFGDGGFSTEKNPVHRFRKAGTYSVCLVISKVESGHVTCLDSISHSITTATYRNLGGHLFAGNFPINNPVSTGDTGVAYLYRIAGTKAQLVDTNQFTHLGYYTFPQVIAGNYLVRAWLTPGSVHYRQFFPTYYEDQIKWFHAGWITIADSGVYSAHVYLSPTADSLPGLAAVKGFVTLDESDDPESGKSVPGATVILCSTASVPLQYTMTNHDGNFQFADIPYGNYQLYVDLPGKYSRFTALSVLPPVVVRDSIHLELFNHNVTAIREMEMYSISLSSAFPNPASDDLFLVVKQLTPGILTFIIYDLAGRAVSTTQLPSGTGPEPVNLSLHSLMSGVYFLVVKSNNGSQARIQKIIKN